MNKNRSDCPISCSLDIFGDKWSLLIIRDLMLKGNCTYGDFQKSDEKIASNILANRLQLLEENEIIIKLEHPNSKAKVLYKLSPKGIDLLPVIVEIQLWAEKYLEISEERKKFIEIIKRDKAAFLASQHLQLIESN